MSSAYWLQGPLNGVGGMAPILASGWYNGPTGGISTLALTANQMYAIAFPVGRSVTIDRIGIEVTTNIAATTIRLGAYGSLSTGMPGALLFDAGTVDSSTTGNKEITISQRLPQGLVWLVAGAQGGAPTVRSLTSVFNALAPRNTFDVSVARTALRQASITGGLPADASGFTSSPTACPAILVRGA